MKSFLSVCFLMMLFPMSQSFAKDPKDQLIELLDQILAIENSVFKEKSDEEVIDSVKDNVRGNLRDPESARFQDLQIIRQEDAIYACGKVNAKNAYGGYTGFKWFFASPISAFNSEGDDAGEIVIAHYCFPHLLKP